MISFFLFKKKCTKKKTQKKRKKNTNKSKLKTILPPETETNAPFTVDNSQYPAVDNVPKPEGCTLMLN